MSLTSKRLKFCYEYLVDYNGRQAAIRAGFSPRSAHSQAHDLLKLAEVRETISRISTDSFEVNCINNPEIQKTEIDRLNDEIRSLRAELKSVKCLNSHHQKKIRILEKGNLE